ncbi:30S ribosomal protein S17 [candidate division CPR3 bacterium GWF2_35_18]|uniref:Small ribosomal subunit protein uS17 n=1 Tax=candidate division CPR3 bacterium GW2011_GWF2_35_18 TaxID=1618350 RepID=A0A0G0BJM8_UNCC3|nr:MAG: 30S ribosomal protein S17 [candidate division CPR3 bacterium GW2011_GWF2_35_18]KKP86070.1 MAG: 30S ribosomal protein S17 [candidate division CPR3 bacterium GW2011_GWE2_35_7]OGB63163.1 MAG: 30S ribosomal protein S17 [candidate division CPR3 bacterium GWF2_35_18]OGB64023.1 MAG: 30S ribosomal protein S17 [candidate division CPR3 bacterium RIFOXYA2_FULL_35_13]OGB75707.1 MAG: 30S ribosomal protein S17 [candidate division CPR3 bacterium RIFOXYC2_FULL_35_7]OGB80155.1 MAG: 30S ribosomal protei
MSKKIIQGLVVSDKMEKTVVVSVEGMKVHPIYQKRMRRHKKYKAHNELGAVLGDMVILEEVKPMSKDKKFIVKEIINKNGELK